MLIWLGLVRFLIICLGLPKQCPYQCDKDRTDLITHKKRKQKKYLTIVKSGTISQLAATVLVSPGFSPRRSMLLPTRGAVDGSPFGGLERYFAFFPTVGTSSLMHRSWRAIVSVSHVSSLLFFGCTSILTLIEERMYVPDTQQRPY